MARKQVRDDGRYSSKISLGNGKYKYVYAYSPSELEKKVRQIKGKQDRGLDLSAERDTFGYWREKWLKLKALQVSDGRYKTYCGRAKNLDPIALYPIDQVRSADIQDIIIELATFNPNTKKPMAKQTLREIKQVAAQIIQLAIDNRVLDYNCAASVKIPSDAKKESKEALTEEQRRWIEETPHRAQTAAMIMLYAGLRRGELMPLQWRDIDLNKACISVNKSACRTSDGMEIKKGGKTKNATRTVYIPQKLVDYLRPLQGLPFELVCPSAHGKLMTDTAWRRLWESYLKELNFKYGKFENSLEWLKNHSGRPTSKFAPEKLPMVIPHFTAHSLRHTFITMLYMAGVDVLTAKEQAGHADIQTTLAIYTHLNNEYKMVNMSKLNQYLQELPKNGVVS